MTTGVLSRLAGLTVEYAHLIYIGRFVKVHHHVRGLQRAEARVTIAALALTGTVVVAMPALAWLGVRLPSVQFEQTSSIPTVALFLALLALGAGLAYAVAGAAQGPALLWLIVAAEYVFLVVSLGVVVKKTYLHLVPVLLPVTVGALTPGVRPWGQYAVIAFCAYVAAEVTPVLRDVARLLMVHGLSPYMLWAPVAVPVAVLHHALARRPWPSAESRILLAAAGTLVYIGAITALARTGDVVEQLDTTLTLVIGTISLLWFVLGTSFVETGIEFAHFARRSLETIAPARALDWTIGLGWVVLAAVVVRSSPAGEHLPVRPVALIILGAMLVVLADRARSRRLSRDWLAGWFVASVAAVLVLRAYGTIDIRAITNSAGAVTDSARALGLAGFVYAITWEIVGEIWNVPLETPHFPRPAPLVLYLAGAILACAAALFGIAARLDIFQKYIIVNEYWGAVYLSIPIALLAVAHRWRLLPHEALRWSVTAFYWGAVMAVPAFLLRSVAGGPGSDGIVLLALVLLVAALMRRAPRHGREPRAAAALGVAAALGLVIGLAQPVLVSVLSALLNMAASLSDLATLETAAQRVLGFVQQAEDQPPNLVGFFLGAPALAIAAALASVWMNRLRPRGSRGAESGNGPAASAVDAGAGTAEP